MKILLCHNFYRKFGGEDSAVIALKQILESKGFSVVFYSRDNKETSRYSLAQKLFLFPNTFFSLRTYRDIKKIATEFKPDVAHIHNTFPLISPSIYSALKRAKIPIVQTIHNFRFLCPNGQFYSKGEICERCKNGNYISAIVRKCYRSSYILSFLYAASIWLHRILGTFSKKVDKALCLSDFTASKLTERLFCPGKTVVISNFLNADFTSDCHREKYAVFIGRLSKEKGLLTLIRAFEGIKEFNLKIMGDGPMAEQLKEYVRRNKISNVELLGFIDGGKRFEILKKAMFSIIPSEWYENQPMAVLEAFAFGVPVIASKIGSLEEIVEDGKNGLLFQMGNSNDLRDKIKHFIDNTGKRMICSEYARYCAETKYSAETNCSKLLKIYKEVIEKNKQN
jgi:glycosyltransferase involved in cell wall biosynthesis